MTAIELSKLQDKDYRKMTVSELRGVKLAAGHAYSAVGDHEKFNPIVMGNQFNTLELAEKKAQVWIDIKEGR